MNQGVDEEGCTRAPHCIVQLRLLLPLPPHQYAAAVRPYYYTRVTASHIHIKMQINIYNSSVGGGSSSGRLRERERKTQWPREREREQTNVLCCKSVVHYYDDDDDDDVQVKYTHTHTVRRRHVPNVTFAFLFLSSLQSAFVSVPRSICSSHPHNCLCTLHLFIIIRIISSGGPWKIISK